MNRTFSWTSWQPPTPTSSMPAGDKDTDALRTNWSHTDFANSDEIVCPSTPFVMLMACRRTSWSAKEQPEELVY